MTHKLRPILGVVAGAAGVARAATGDAACAIPETQPNPTFAAQFHQSPQVLLTTFRHGGYFMQVAVARLAADVPDDVGRVVGLAQTASAGQVEAIALGLRYAADLCGAEMPELPERIAFQVTHANAPKLTQVYFELENREEDPALGTVDPSLAAARPGKSEAPLVLPQDLSIPPELNGDIVADPFAPQAPTQQ
jgi:hypothetical protein